MGCEHGPASSCALLPLPGFGVLPCEPISRIRGDLGSVLAPLGLGQEGQRPVQASGRTQPATSSREGGRSLSLSSDLSLFVLFLPPKMSPLGNVSHSVT